VAPFVICRLEGLFWTFCYWC